MREKDQNRRGKKIKKFMMRQMSCVGDEMNVLEYNYVGSW
jgi:hypothetical protein